MANHQLFSKHKGKDFSGVYTVIGTETTIKGTIDAQESLRIEGVFEGAINAQGDVYVGEGATVKAKIHGRRVVIAGETHGNIEALNGLEILSTGRVYGDITGDRLIVDEGAIYKGNVKMDIITSRRSYDAEDLDS